MKFHKDVLHCFMPTFDIWHFEFDTHSLTKPKGERFEDWRWMVWCGDLSTWDFKRLVKNNNILSAAKNDSHQTQKELQNNKRQQKVSCRNHQCAQPLKRCVFEQPDLHNSQSSLEKITRSNWYEQPKPKKETMHHAWWWCRWWWCKI